MTVAEIEKEQRDNEIGLIVRYLSGRDLDKGERIQVRDIYREVVASVPAGGLVNPAYIAEANAVID